MAHNPSGRVVPDPLASFITGFDDARGWFSAWPDAGGVTVWRPQQDMQVRPRLYCPAAKKYPSLGYEYFAVDGMGRITIGQQPFECTIHPYTGKFERLCVQTRDSICRMRNSTWDRTVIRRSGPGLLLIALFPRQGIHKSKRWSPGKWDLEDWLSVAARWIPASLGILLLVFLPTSSQPADKNPHTYLPFRYNGYRYPRIARNVCEDRRDHFQRTQRHASGITELTTLYRAFRPRYLCYLKETEFRLPNGEMAFVFETRPVAKDDYTPYVFISYTKEQFVVANDEPATERMHQLLFTWAIKATLYYVQSRAGGASPSSYAFWLDAQCMPMRIADDNLIERNDLNEVERRELADRDVYTMSDIIRGAETTIVLTNTSAKLPDGTVDKRRAIVGWGERVWTLPEVILSSGKDVILQINDGDPRPVPKVRLAELAWTDSGEARQLVEHYTTMHLSRLELVSISLKCLHERKLKGRYDGDRSYALMGLLRLRPRIDIEDSSFQAFARLSLPQDNDRLMERLICLLPESSHEPWDTMSDVYKSSLWDIYPLTQVCGVGENDTIVVDGFKGAMIQWSMFSTVQTIHRSTLIRKVIILGTTIAPPVLIFVISILLWMGYQITDTEAYDGPGGYVPGSHTSRDVKRAGFSLLTILITFLLAAPLFLPHLYNGKLYEAEPCLFGIEGYVPLPEVEEMLFGLRLGRLKWSTYGSPLSRHCDKKTYREVTYRDSVENDSSTTSTLPVEHGDIQAGNHTTGYVYTHPVEAVDPCEPCQNCRVVDNGWKCNDHITLTDVEIKSRSSSGDMKIFMLIDTYCMTATLFEARRPPVALLVGGSEGGMKRALACSLDITTGTMYRETVLRMPSQTMDKMLSMQRVRLGLKNPRDRSALEDVQPPLA